MTRSASQSLSGLLPASWLAMNVEDFLPVPSSVAEADHWVGPELNVSSSGFKLYLQGGPRVSLANSRPKAFCTSESEVPGMLAGLKNVAVSFDIGLALSSLVPLPKTSKSKSEKILSVRREQSLPFASSYIHGWFELDAASSANKRFVNEVIVKREWFDRVVRVFEGTKSNCEMLIVRDGLAVSLPVVWNANGNNYRSTEIRRWKNLLWIGLVSLLVGGSSVGAALIYQHGFQSAKVEKHIALLQPEATRLSKAKQAQTQLHDQLEKFALAVSPKLLVSQNIERLAGLLGDDVVLTGLSFDRGAMVIEGAALAPEGLIPLLNNGNDFTDVSFSAPVFRNPGEAKSRFAIKLRILGYMK